MPDTGWRRRVARECLPPCTQPSLRKPPSTTTLAADRRVTTAAAPALLRNPCTPNLPSNPPIRNSHSNRPRTPQDHARTHPHPSIAPRVSNIVNHPPTTSPPLVAASRPHNTQHNHHHSPTRRTPPSRRNSTHPHKHPDPDLTRAWLTTRMSRTPNRTTRCSRRKPISAKYRGSSRNSSTTHHISSRSLRHNMQVKPRRHLLPLPPTSPRRRNPSSRRV